MAVASLVLAIASLAFAWSLAAGLVMAIVALVLANKAGRVGVAKAGFIIAIISLVINIIDNISWIACGGFLSALSSGTILF